MARYWRCQRVANGEKCGELNLGTKKKCHACGKLRPAKRQPAHRAVLAEMPYEEWVAIFGEQCGICGHAAAKRRLDRDHDHKTGAPRGLLCHLCNRTLGNRVTAEWLRAALAYLERDEARAA